MPDEVLGVAGLVQLTKAFGHLINLLLCWDVGEMGCGVVGGNGIIIGGGGEMGGLKSMGKY